MTLASHSFITQSYRIPHFSLLEPRPMHYRELIVWQKAMGAAREVYRLAPMLPKAESETLLTLCEQIGWFPEAETEKLRRLLDEVSRILTTMRRKHRETMAGERPLREK